jgi:uncharacterized membrane protein
VKERIEIEDWLTPEELGRVRDAVSRAEQHTSGEIRVHLDVAIMENVLDHAAFVFNNLGMDKTRERNGVLLYVSVPGRKVAVVGDTGIHAKLGNYYWQNVLDAVLANFRQDRFCEGLCEGVRLLGEKLKEHFPHRDGDQDELSNEVSFGK